LEGTAGHRRPQLILDGVKYHSISTEKIPSAVADVPVKLNDNGAIFDTVMVAGLVGSRLTSSKGPSADAPDTLSPVAGWWIYISKTEEELRLEAEAKSEREKKELEEMMAKYRLQR
jgi:phosphomannomutase